MRKKKGMKKTYGVDDLKSEYNLLKELTKKIDDDNDTPETRLHLIAQSKLIRPIRPDELREKLERQLQNLPYPFPEERKDRQHTKSFYQILKSHGADGILLGQDVLQEITRALQLVEIALIDSEYGKDGLSGYGLSLKFHRAMLREIQRHQDRIVELREKHKILGSWGLNYTTQIRVQKWKEMDAISSSVWPGNRKAIMGSGWSPGLASAVRVFYVLRRELKGTRLSQRYLRSLALIIVSDQELPQINPESLRIAIHRRDKK